MSVNFEYFDTEKLIIEVEKRSALYKKVIPEYSDKNVKERLWTEVCEATVPNWGELNKDLRIKKGKDVQRKWKNIKDNFRKKLNQQKKTVSGEGKRKRRKYIYFEQLLFLLPTFKERETSGNCTPPPTSGEQRDSQTEDNDVQVPKTPLRKVAINNEKTRKKPTYEESLLQILKESKTQDIDEDKSFLLSLWSSFRKLSPHQKLTAKIGFLQVLQQVSFPTNYQHAGISSVNQYPNMNSPFFPPQIPTQTQHMINPQQYSSGAASTFSVLQSPPNTASRPSTSTSTSAPSARYYSTPSPEQSYSSILSVDHSTSDNDLFELH